MARTTASRTERHPTLKDIMIPFAVIVVISVALIGGLVVIAARGQERVAVNDSVHLARSVVASIKRRLADQLLDYSYWDQAVDNLVTEPSPTWADNNVGIYMHDNFGINTSFVLDTANRATYGMIGGKRSDAIPMERFSGGVEALMKRTRAAPANAPPVPATGLLKNGGTVHIAALSVLTSFPTAGQKQDRIATGWILMFTRALDDRLLAEISENFLLEDLRWVASEDLALSAMLPLDAIDGTRLGYLTWRVGSPAKQMLGWLLPLIGVVFLIFAGTAYIFFQRSQTVTETLARSVAEIETAQNALRTSEERFRAIVDGSPAAITLKDRDGRILLANRVYGTWMMSDPADLVGKTAHDLFPPDDAKSIEKSDHKVFERAQVVVEETRRTFLDGKRRDLLNQKSPIHSASGDIVAIGAVITDISELKAAEAAMKSAKEAAEHANRAKSGFLANMSHELRSPLNSMIGFAQVMAEKTFGPLGSEKYEEYADDITRSGTHLLDLINDILDISKIEAGGMKLIEQEVEVPDIVDATIRMVTDKAERRRITIEKDLADKLPRLRGDELRLKQILLNLLTNAVKYTAPRGRVSVSTFVDEDKVMSWQVADTGVGIPEDDLPRILEPFEQVHGSSDLSHEGVGLGLHLTKSLVEMHGATIEIDSVVDEGTTVTVRFPVERVIWS